MSIAETSELRPDRSKAPPGDDDPLARFGGLASVLFAGAIFGFF